MVILVTNNPRAELAYREKLRVEYNDESLLTLLIRVRDYIQSGCCLLTHPLSGSMKPNETPYKSILISGVDGETDPRSVQIIEGCLSTARKFEPARVPDKYLQDLQMIDLALIGPALEKIQQN